MKKFDKITYFFTYFSSGITALILISILLFTFINGKNLLNYNLLISDYNTTTYTVSVESNNYYQENFIEDSYYSANWGIALSDSKDTEGKSNVVITYISKDSPFQNAIDTSGNKIEVLVNSSIASYIKTDNGSALVSKGAQYMIEVLDGASSISSFSFQTSGGGIRGSLISTIVLIGLTLVIVVPFGIFASIYINEYGKKSKLLTLLQNMIDMLSGVPSIIYGLMGAAVFIPFVNSITNTSGTSGSLYAGALTMSVILLPVIIKTTIEGLKSVPNDLRQASLGLGASETQTIFKVVLPNAIGSISTGVILAIGRIVGESAALVFVIGTYISDTVSPQNPSTTLAVHIWSIMAGESPNFELASSIALIILIFVLVINLLVKFLSKKLNKFI